MIEQSVDSFGILSRGAEIWYRKSLEIEESLGDRPDMAMTYVQMGLLAIARGNAQDALEWTVRCVGLFDERSERHASA